MDDTSPQHTVLCTQNNLSAGMIVAGHDARDGGSVYALPLGGTLVKVPFSIGENATRWGQPLLYAVLHFVCTTCRGACNTQSLRPSHPSVSGNAV